MNTLYLEYWAEGKDFYMYAESDDFEKELTIKGQGKQIVEQFENLYEILQDLDNDRISEFKKLITSLSKSVIYPFEKQIKECDLLRFVIYDDMIRAALDLLEINGEPLFLQKQICFQVEAGEGEAQPKLKLNSALLVADLTADPDKACADVAKLFPTSKYYDVSKASLSLIKQYATKVDALIISAHGDLDDENSGEVYINEIPLDSDTADDIESSIVYFDSCQQGANLDFIETLQEEGEVQFYLAPLTSNQAGDSSTKTMIWFFTDLLKHGNPIKALFDTRKKLYEFYTNKNLDPLKLLYKAYPFRIYEIVEAYDEDEDEDEEDDE